MLSQSLILEVSFYKYTVIIANKPQTKPTFDRVFKLFYYRFNFMLRFFLILLTVSSLFGAKVEDFRWENGVTYSDFLENTQLPRKYLLDNLDTDDRRLVEEIRAGVNCNYLRDNNNEIVQVLIPLNDELQIHIYKTKKSYKFEAIPIVSNTKVEAFSLKIQIKSVRRY